MAGATRRHSRFSSLDQALFGWGVFANELPRHAGVTRLGCCAAGLVRGQPWAGVLVVPESIVVVGAPHYFYFGLINGNTAADKFYKLYVTDY